MFQMNLNLLKKYIALVFGLVAILIFLVFTLVAAACFPGNFTPVTNWLSDLEIQLLTLMGQFSLTRAVSWRA